ncbi:unnamed protein product [Cercospora beticola]|nr:unnamed protein product [Cercospora beticola]
MFHHHVRAHVRRHFQIVDEATVMLFLEEWEAPREDFDAADVASRRCLVCGGFFGSWAELAASSLQHSFGLRKWSGNNDEDPDKTDGLLAEGDGSLHQPTWARNVAFGPAIFMLEARGKDALWRDCGPHGAAVQHVKDFSQEQS